MKMNLVLLALRQDFISNKQNCLQTYVELERFWQLQLHNFG
jgi:hypothetical protein